MCILDLVVHYKRSQCLCITCVCLDSKSADGPVFFFFLLLLLSHLPSIQLNGLFVGGGGCGWGGRSSRSDLLLLIVRPFSKLFYMKTRHLMLHGCMLEYLKGKTREREKKKCCPLLATRGLFFFNSFIFLFYFVIFFILNSKSGIMAIQHAFRCVIIM